MQSAGGDADAKEYPCLIRVTDGKKAKISTQVREIFASQSSVAHGH
jgi:hypothetical protein